MQFLIDQLYFLFTNSYVLLFIKSLSCVCKIYIFSHLLFSGIFLKKLPRPIVFLIGVLVGEVVVDGAWIYNLLGQFYLDRSYTRTMIFILRWAWAFELIKFQSLGLFIESLGEKKYKIPIHQKILLLFTGIFVAFFMTISFTHFNAVIAPPLASKVVRICVFYTFIMIFLPSYTITKKLRDAQLPKILRKQITMFLKFLIAPYLFSQLLEITVFESLTHAYIATCISAPLLTAAIFYSLRKVMGLRFLNFESHVQSKEKSHPINNFKTVLENLSYATNLKELVHITQQFFKDEFRIQSSRTSLRIRSEKGADEAGSTAADVVAENFIVHHSNQGCPIAEFMKKQKILIADEITFSNFYEEDKAGREISKFLSHIGADIFLPIYEQDAVLAYIMVERDARPQEFFTSTERDQMIVFSSYLANIINLLRTRNIEAIIQREKRLQEELYRKHQEIDQYKESVRSFFRDTKQRTIGVIFYKNKKFIFGNQAAKDLITVNINQQIGHPLTKMMRKIASQVETYKTSYSCLTTDPLNGRLVLSALPNIEQNNVIITVNYPEISDLLKNHLDLLKNPSEWDYLLYLETTHSGQLINHLIPSCGGILLNFKIELLKLALSNKALLLELPEEDIMPTLEILHHVSMRKTLYTLTLEAPDKGFETGIRLFGINQILDTKPEPALLEQLNNVGTLFIRNIHFLHLEAQEALAEFIRYGYYRIVKSDKKVGSNARIICSTNQDLSQLVHEGKFSESLFNELKQASLNMPSLLLLPKDELDELIDSFTEQAVTSPLFKNLLELSLGDRSKLVGAPPASIQEFKTRVHQLLIQKSKKKNIYEEASFDPAYHVRDPDLIEAARLGKAALRDQRIMAMLWNKFKNQNEIALFLGVNRSSVNRRCKEFNLV
jgi:hypothetical protein